MMGIQPEIVFIKPQRARKVPIPQYMRDTKEYFGNYLPEDGLQVQKTLFWIKRKQDDDIEEVSESDDSPIEQETADTARNKLKKAKQETQE
ncbi:hypothetical protein ARAF_2341 [Arsenophonus endosymbiont of Aleurodicus floccissimus]|uniref:DUF2635 domain-containing protein n=1 Tax=Arsenophonus endosymbiont of Aleurodicus floccissimus TaxID=2152761 RepID=UPI000E6B494C|nr:DUF2635 domain-containing protein [Arsenophonus endosymbiont of Aleurodicus floccissimus]SPP32300.1 hypothetical protein ARAF_2341 [Arsenophonus endosymbiont of Aleurodicus floccissimus]